MPAHDVSELVADAALDRPEILAVVESGGRSVTWAALDCPGGWAGDLATYPSVLGRMTARTLYFAPGSARSAGRPPSPADGTAGATELAPLEVPLSRTLIVAASVVSPSTTSITVIREIPNR